jgi:hypothetical protein
MARCGRNFNISFIPRPSVFMYSVLLPGENEWHCKRFYPSFDKSESEEIANKTLGDHRKDETG